VCQECLNDVSATPFNNYSTKLRKKLIIIDVLQEGKESVERQEQEQLQRARQLPEHCNVSPSRCQHPTKQRTFFRLLDINW
ncbi:hypothetical protein KI387_024625, partial [Taxus chinensis]